ncbi:uncharacterized protein EMH_0088320 [Eimeria mitis]|uniref:Uncharacterized protein n=1 Tax=Eimeria mitis TaxID=44415 RepID=U6K832_9EIME|nr:uncharacterized protein EMH_0088320 [Eimeria mitis]CDJ34175.1 hypothetical protein EMH_0088320 [Eimeria mitis]
MYEAVIRNAFIRLTHKPSLRRYRPDNEFSRFFTKVKFVLPSLDDEQALVSLNNQRNAPTSGDPDLRTSLKAAEPPHLSTSSASEAKPGTGDEKHDNASPPAQKDISKANMIQLDPTDHPIFRFKNVSYDVFQTACTKSGGDITSHSFLTWLLDHSGTSALQVMEYIEHYPYRIPKEDLFDQDSDVIFLLCHPTGRENKGSACSGCIMDRYLGHLLAKSEAAVSNACQLILSGDARRLSAVAQSYSFPLEKLNRAVCRLKVILLMLGKLREKSVQNEKKDEPDTRDLFKR